MHQEQIVVQVELHPNQDAGLSTPTVQPLELRLVDPATGVELYRLTFISPNLTVEKHESIFHLGAYQVRLDVHRSTVAQEEQTSQTTVEDSFNPETEAPVAEPQEEMNIVLDTAVEEPAPADQADVELGDESEAVEEIPSTASDNGLEATFTETELPTEEPAAEETEAAAEPVATEEDTTEGLAAEEAPEPEAAAEDTTEEPAQVEEELQSEGRPLEMPELDALLEAFEQQSSEEPGEQEAEPAPEVSAQEPFLEETVGSVEPVEAEATPVEPAEEIIIIHEPPIDPEPEIQAEAEAAPQTEVPGGEEWLPVAEEPDFSAIGDEGPAEFSEFDRAILNDYYQEEAASIDALLSGELEEDQLQLILETKHTIDTFADREGMGPWFLNSRFRDNRDRLLQEAGLFFGEKQEPLVEALNILTRVYLITLLLSKPATWSSLATQVAVRETRDGFSLLGLLDFQQVTESCLMRVEPFVNNNVLYRFRSQVGLLEAVEAC